PSGIVRALPHVIVDPAFLMGGVITLAAVAEGLVIALVIGTFVGLIIGRSPPICQRRLYAAHDRRAAAGLALVRLHRWSAFGDGRLCRAVLDHGQRRGWCAQRAAGISRGRAVLPFGCVARPLRDRPAVIDAVFPRRAEARRGPRADRRHRRRILHRDPRPRLFHSLQLAHV